MSQIIDKCSQCLVLGLMMTGCSPVRLASDDGSEQTHYQAAIVDAAVIEQAEIVPLPVVEPGKIRVVTWTEYPKSYPEGQEILLAWGDVWVTLAGDVKSRCRGFDEDTLTTDLQKLLGLPPDASESRSFVTLEVDAESLFRPCANPSLQADSCTPEIPKDVPPSHVSWYGKQVAQSYQLASGYPWTRLGYTYNWKAGENEVGPAEFVIRKGSRVLPLSVIDTGLYCGE